MRLPRDWLGPPEELVPIGPAGRARARAAGLLDDDPRVDLPPTAHDFWGEDSAALHDAIQGPDHAAPATPAGHAAQAGHPANAATAPSGQGPAPVATRSSRRPKPPLPPLGRPRVAWNWEVPDVRDLPLKWLALLLPVAAVVIAVSVLADAGSPAHRARARAQIPSLPAKTQSTPSAATATAPPVISSARSERPSVTRVARRTVQHHSRPHRSLVSTSRSHYIASSTTGGAANRTPAPSAGGTRTLAQSSAPATTPVVTPQPSPGATASTAGSTSTNQSSRSTGDSAASLLGGIGSCVKGC